MLARASKGFNYRKWTTKKDAPLIYIEEFCPESRGPKCMGPQQGTATRLGREPLRRGLHPDIYIKIFQRAGVALEGKQACCGFGALPVHDGLLFLKRDI